MLLQTSFVLALLLIIGVNSQDLPTNNVFQNVQAYNQTEDVGVNTYHISVVNQYAPQYLQNILTGPGPVTFFAPSDHSFIRLQQSDPAFLEQWKANPDLIRATLFYHILDQSYDIKTAPPHSTLPSHVTPYTIDATILPNDPAKNPPGWIPGILKGNGNPNISATIVHTMPSSNGILYVIDTMLRPSQAAIDAAAKMPNTRSPSTATASATSSAAAATGTTTPKPNAADRDVNQAATKSGAVSYAKWISLLVWPLLLLCWEPLSL